MRYLLALLVILLCVGAGGCSLGRHVFLQGTAKEAVPVPDDGSDQELDIHAHFQESNVTLNFTTARTPEQVLQWYRDTLAARGWQLASESDSDDLQHFIPPRMRFRRAIFVLLFYHSSARNGKLQDLGVRVRNTEFGLWGGRKEARVP